MPHCSRCKRPTREIHYPTGGLCPICREEFETRRDREREDERRRRDLEYQRGLAGVRESFRHDHVFYAAIRRADWDDPISLQNLHDLATQRGRLDYAERLREVAKEKGFDTTGWEKAFPEKFNPTWSLEDLRRSFAEFEKAGLRVERHLGSGSHGVVVLLEDGRVLKTTDDQKEAAMALWLMEEPRPNLFPTVFEVWSDQGEFGIVREEIDSIAPEAVDQKALNALRDAEARLRESIGLWIGDAYDVNLGVRPSDGRYVIRDFGSVKYYPGSEGSKAIARSLSKVKEIRPIRERRRRNDGHVARWKLLSIEPSWIKGKKFAAIFHDEVHDRTKTTHFGAAGYEDYTTHKDPERKARYLERHGRGREDWDDPTTPGALSRWILWNKPTLRASIEDFKRRFRL